MEYNSLASDIRLIKTSKEISLNALRDIAKKQSWIYIKVNIEKISFGELQSQTAYYNKFRVKSIILEENGNAYIYGDEDNDRFIFSLTDVIQSEISPCADEVLFIVQSAGTNTRTSIYIRKFAPNIERSISSIFNTDRNLIITEGKTDWKHLKAAHTAFLAMGLYDNLDFDFLEYENSIADGNINLSGLNISGCNTLSTLCEYTALFHNDKLRVFIFDSDVEKIVDRYYDEGGFKCLGNNVYAVILPVPPDRQSTPHISIEHYYTDEEIKTPNSSGHRLYLSDEFPITTPEGNQIHLIGRDRKKQNFVVDDNIYMIPRELIADGFDLKALAASKKLVKVRALSKNEFAENVLKEVPPFNLLSKNNFKLIFDVIDKIKAHASREYAERGHPLHSISIQQGVILDYYRNHTDLNIRVCMNREQIGMLRESPHCTSLHREDGQIILSLGTFNWQCEVNIDASDEILDFFSKKYYDHSNRIYWSIYDASNNYVFSKEIFMGDSGDMLIGRILY